MLKQYMVTYVDNDDFQKADFTDSIYEAILSYEFHYRNHKEVAFFLAGNDQYGNATYEVFDVTPFCELKEIDK